MDGRAHDRTRDRDVIDAAFLISRIARERGVSPADLISTIIFRVWLKNRDPANIGDQANIGRQIHDSTLVPGAPADIIR